MNIVQTVKDARAHITIQKVMGRKVGFVPTMGALHDGHLSLVTLAKKQADYVVMSIFVNPTQFNSREDFDRYPRVLDTDFEKAKSAGVDLIFAPDETELYKGSSGKLCTVKAGSTAEGLCGATRPGHFDGVVTVVSILFNIVTPSSAVFGEKDYQQLKVIEQLCRDLHVDVRIIPAPLLRDPDGLAMSSRNLLLSAEERSRALSISRGLFAAQALAEKGETVAAALIEAAREPMRAAGLREEYVELVHCQTLAPIERLEGEGRLLAAAFCGKVRLIDNVRVKGP